MLRFGTLTLRWSSRSVPAVTVSASADGVAYTAVAVENWPARGAGLVSPSLTGA